MQDSEDPSVGVSARAHVLYTAHRNEIHREVDLLFAYLMLVQWAFAVCTAIAYSPYAWSGKVQTIHVHVQAAVLLGGLITGLPVVLAFKRPGWVGTRYVIACAQMLWSALLIHLSGGRIETHFHIFGSLAFLSFYREWKVLIPATFVVASDHLVRQIFWPESVYGVVDPEWWRFLEHALWVVFEDIILVLACIRGQKEMLEIATRQAQVEALSELERKHSQQLANSQQALVRSEKLAAVGKLAASVGHELRNPLTAVKNANAVLQKRLLKAAPDAQLDKFLGIMDRELVACTRIVTDLLDFARERPLELEPVPLRALVDEAISVLPEHSVAIRNQVPESLPVPTVDRSQFRQILINLLQNAVEAIPANRSDGWVSVTALGGANEPWQLVVEDSGVGMSSEVAAKIFEPLFTTKVKGTGLGMSIVANVIRQHNATVRVDSEIGRGTRIAIELPALTERAA